MVQPTMYRFLAALFATLVCTAKAGDFVSKFAVIMIDRETEAKLGPFPYDRAVMASAVNVCAKKGAKAVALKFFFDLPKTAAGDKALCNAMANMSVLLQARLESETGTAQAMPERFSLPASLPTAIRGDRGWIPLPMFLERAAACGFVDFNSRSVPMVERYRDKNYKSFVVCCLEVAFDKSAVYSPHQVAFGSQVLRVDGHNVFHAELRSPSWKAFSFAKLLSDEIREEDLKGRVVIIGWDGAKAERIEGVGIHVYFVQVLAAAYEALEAQYSRQ